MAQNKWTSQQESVYGQKAITSFCSHSDHLMITLNRLQVLDAKFCCSGSYLHVLYIKKARLKNLYCSEKINL